MKVINLPRGAIINYKYAEYGFGPYGLGVYWYTVQFTLSDIILFIPDKQ